MRVQNECNCCGALYTVVFTEIPAELDPDLDSAQEEDSEFYPEFCPFCGSHESEEGSEDE